MKRFITRRQALQDAAIGFGAMAANSMLQQERLFAAESALAKERTYDLKPKPSHFPAKAKRVIFIYIGGGPSTIDMFDPKPTLMKYDGPAEELLQKCAEKIEREALPQDRADLLTVSEVLTGLRFLDPELLRLFGGKKPMIESPMLQKMMAERS